LQSNLRIGVFGFGRVGNVNPEPPDVENDPRLTRVALLPMATVVSTPLKVSVAVFAPDPSVTVFVPEPAQASERRQVNTPPLPQPRRRRGVGAGPRAGWRLSDRQRSLTGGAALA
jgi:hypothetical protein